MGLLSSFGKQGVKLNLLQRSVDIEDTEYLSKYFDLSEFNPLFTSGKNAVSFNGSSLLKTGSEIQVECLDSYGNSLYIEQAKSTDKNQYSDSAKFVISIHVYDEVNNGNGKLVLVGTTIKGEKVRWIGNITIDKTLDNISKVRFYYKPTMEIRPLLYPVVDTGLAKTQYPPPAPPVVASATATILSKVSSISVLNGGTGYTVATITFSGGGGSGAIATAILSGGSIQSIVVNSGGTGYTSAPMIVISGDGIGATATATLSGEVISISITDGGSGYTDIPDVTIIGGNGLGATATAVINDGKVSSVTVTNGGSGYTTSPSVIFASTSADAIAELNIPIDFEAEFHSFAAFPNKDSLKSSLNDKQIDVDYRIVLQNISNDALTSSLFPTKAFNSQMEGKTIDLYIDTIQLPFSHRESSTNITQSFIIKKVIDSKTALLNSPYFYTSGQNEVVTNISRGICHVSYRFISYNTNKESNKTIDISSTVSVDVKDSYAEITYRNLRTYSGYIARHKLYRKSSFYPGDFQLISDEPLNAIELLSDTITFNKFYDNIGKIYNQAHLEKYWFTSSNNVSITASTTPINSMIVNMGSYDNINETEYIIVKSDSIGVTNDNVYYPYDSTEFNRLSGSSYNSNFISLKKDAFYEFSSDVIMYKNYTETDAKISVYFTSSVASIRNEKGFDSKFGLKIGEISTTDRTNIKYFKDKQSLFFTPNNDYYGTLVFVPYKCNMTLSNISLKIYGDYGFSPDILFIRIPFPINVKNEAFELHAELFDINSNVVFSSLNATHTFDENGESLYSNADSNVKNDFYITNAVIQNAYLPNLTNCSGSNQRFVAWQLPQGLNDDTDGKLCYTNVSNLYIDNDDYIVLSAYESGVEHTAKSLAIKYNSTLGLGRKIFIDVAGNKEEFP